MRVLSIVNDNPDSDDRSGNPRPTFRVGCRAPARRPIRSAHGRSFIAQELQIEAVRRRALADVGGEVNETTPLQLSLEPRALRVVVPRGFRADEA